MSHPQLTKVDGATVESELRDSAAAIEAAGLPRPRALAYPHGEWSPEIAAAAARAGYAVSFTIAPGRITGGSERQALPRIEVLASDTDRTLRMKLATVDWPERLRDRLLARMGARR